MSRLEKLVSKFLRRPSEARFKEVVYVLEHFGYTLDPKRGDHPAFVKPGGPTIVVPLMKGRHKVKGVYIIRNIVIPLNLEEWYEQRQRS